MLDQPYMTDLIEANSMGHEPNLIDIYSASWGPTDDGRTVDGPRNATMRAIVRGVNEVTRAEFTFQCSKLKPSWLGKEGAKSLEYELTVPMYVSVCYTTRTYTYYKLCVLL